MFRNSFRDDSNFLRTPSEPFPILLSFHLNNTEVTATNLTCRRPLKCVTLTVREPLKLEGRLAIPSMIVLRLDAGTNPQEFDEDLFVGEP